MDFAFSRFEKLKGRPLGVVPDFPVLLAGLSALQSSSPTARRQTTLEQQTGGTDGSIEPLIGLMADGVAAPRRALGASFSSSAAKIVWPPS